MALVANPRDTAGMLRTIRHERPRFICAVPTLLTAIMVLLLLEQTGILGV